MASGWTGAEARGAGYGSGHERRQSDRIDVRLRVHGQLASLNTPILVHDLSRSGFAVLSRFHFQPGQTLDFRLTGADGLSLTVSARAIHSGPMPAAPDMYLSGFMFVPGQLTGLVPQALIDRLIRTVADPDVSCFFESTPRC
jgi:hypothetical protein